MTFARYRRQRCCLIAFILLGPVALILATAQAHANGWEYAAIPFEALIEALEFEAPEMRRRAAISLGFRGQPEAVAPILERLAKPEENPHVRSAIYTALGRLGDRRALAALMACMDKEMRDELRSDCVASLGMIGDKSTLPRLLTSLHNDPSFLVKSRIVDALGNFQDSISVATLVDLISDKGNRALRQRAIRALGQTGSQAAAKPLLKALAASPSDSERLLLVKVLTDLRQKVAVAPLIELLRNTDAPHLRTQIVIALGAIRDGDTYPTLINMLTDEIPAVRYFSVRGLHELRRREAAIPIAKQSTQISQRLEKKTAYELLSDPLPVLADLSFQVVALQALADLDAPAGIEALLRAARPREIPRNSAVSLKIAEGFYQQRRAALNGLGYTRSRKAATFLKGSAGLGDPDFRLRAVAVRSLAVLGLFDAAENLLPLLSDPMAEVRWTAATMLGRLKDQKAVKPLIESLSDPNAEVRRQAAFSLGYLGNRKAYDRLRHLASNDDSETVRTAASYSVRLLDK